MTSTAVLPRSTSRWVPWDGTPRRADLLCWYALAGMAVFYTAMWPVRPLLIGSNPVLLELLTGSKESIIAAGAFAGVGAVPLPVVVAAAMVGMMKFDAIVWWAGTLWGRGIVGKFARRSRVATWFAGKVDSVGPWVMWPAVAMAPWTPVPSSLIYAAAGWTGMRLRTFLVLDGVGTLVRASIYAGLGFAIGQPAVDLAETISANGLWVSLGIVVVMVVGQFARRLVAARRAGHALAVARRPRTTAGSRDHGVRRVRWWPRA
ncbi:membrane protein DedA with SNARE-associated domain [Pseudonocardia hierapolitana]|uniref:Membrane protein DedA with SNARE-associated domain n=1 Tax=Pseudonocardia hierapolitana TaxID=1128676 RepID=A0A561SL25_9PSEU|nr:VTT domain-containing protein [Pseudonocardia hierapolitana]TWF75550.1 membrane protein DedA with SNARE-associated domain [Pseudonocardia hierapolitana]